MRTEHAAKVRRWKKTRNYQAWCMCGWVAQWPHTSRRAAEDDGAEHMSGVGVTATLRGSADYWHPGL